MKKSLISLLGMTSALGVNMMELGSIPDEVKAKWTAPETPEPLIISSKDPITHKGAHEYHNKRGIWTCWCGQVLPSKKSL